MPRVLHRNGRLGALYTDFWAGPIVRRLVGGVKGKILRSLGTRFHADLSGAAVTSWNVRALTWEAGLRKTQDGYSSFIDIGSQFATRVRRALEQRNDLVPGSIFFTYDTGGLEAIEWCRNHGIRCIVGQMDPNRVEVELVREEEKLWPGWSAQTVQIPEQYFNRRENEWALADLIMVNSDFCRDALLKQAVPAAKLAVVPLCFEAASSSELDKLPEVAGNKPREMGAPLHVLFLGQVILRKGIQYLIQAARLLEHENIHFDVVGPLGISKSAIESAPQNMTFHGRATRDQTANWYRQSDVFVLPTISDGFAITQLEAMSYGLPVVTTPCCGTVVSNEVDGFIMPPRDANALAKVFLRFLAEPELLRHQRNAALQKAKQFGLDRLAANLFSLENSLQSS